MWVYDLESLAFLEVNEAATAGYGFTRDQFLAMRITDIRPEEDVPRLLANLAQPRGALDESGDWRHRRRDGSLIDVHITSHTMTFGGRPAALVVAADVTQRTRAATALRASEQRYRSLFEGNLAGVWRSTLDGHFIEGNPAMARILGLGSPEQMKGLDAVAFYPDPGVRRELRERLLRDKVITDFVVELRRPGGAHVWVLSSVRLVEDDNGAPLHMEGTSLDITERRRSETALRRSTARLQIMHGIDLAILAADSPAGVAQAVTRHLRALLPAQRVAVLVTDDAFTIAEYLAVDEDRPTGPQVGARIPLSSFPPTPPLYDLSRQPVRLWEDFAAVPNPPDLLRRLLAVGFRSGIDAPLAAEGRLVGALTAVSTEPGVFSKEHLDILAEVASQFAVALHQAQLRQHLAAEQAKLLHLLKDLPSGVILVDERGTVLFANPLGREHLAALGAGGDGAPIITLGGVPLAEVLRPGPGGSARDVEVAQPHRRSFSVKARPVTLVGVGDCSVIVIRDVTLEREQAAQLEAQQRLAVVGEVAGGLAHDLNNILQAIMAFPAGVRGHSLDPEVQEVLNVVADQAQRGATLIRRILDFSRRSTAERRTIEAVSFVDAIAGLLRRTLPENIAVTFAGPPDHRLHISADPTQLEQVLLNLALNARDAMPDGGTLGLSVAPLPLTPGAAPPLARMSPGEWVHVAVADTGTGIKPEHLDRIFEPYFTTKPKGKGTGLGLAQVYGLVGQNGGCITVESVLDEHTTFHLYFPTAPTAAATEPSGPAETPGGAGQTILLAEDEPEVRAALRTVLEVLGYRAVEAPDGVAALAHITAGIRPDLLITDSTMPGMSGAELIVEARRVQPALKVVALTGYSAESVLAKLRESGADEILEKPASVEDLARTVARVLGTPEA